MLTYKMAYLSDNWTSKVVSRVVRDVLTTQRLCRLENIMLIVAANRDLTSVLKGIADVKCTGDLSECNIYRVYVDRSVPRADDAPDPESVVPPDVFDFDIIEVVPPPRENQLVFEHDPYAGINLPYRGVRIPSTMDIMKRAPKPIPEDEPPYNPFR